MANLENIKLGDSVIFSSGGWGAKNYHCQGYKGNAQTI